MFLHFIGHHLLWLAAGGGAGVAARYIQLRHRHFHPVRFVDKDPLDELLRLQALYGYNAHSLVGIAEGSRLWSCPEVPGAVGYNTFGRAWLVPGDPLASEENLPELSRRFVAAAHQQGCIVGFIPATERFALISQQLGLRAIKLGSAPYFDLTTWAPRGDRAKKARAGVNQARRAGVSITKVEKVDERLIQEAAVLCKSWFKTRRSAIKFGWLFTVDLFQHSERKKFFIARDNTGKLVGFLAASPIPTRDGWYLEDVLRLPEAPNGTVELMVVEALNFLKLDGAKIATLGTSPLAREGAVNPAVHCQAWLSRVVRIVLGSFSIFYNFEGLRRFKAKFAPSWWESEYILISPNITAPPRMIYAFIQAILPTGASSLVARHAIRAWRRTIRSREDATSGFTTNEMQGLGVQSTMNENEQVMSQVAIISRSETSPPPGGQFVSVNGLKVHYLSEGTGRPVVLIHGNPGSHQDYSMSVLGRVAKSYRGIALDRPGHGYSERHDSVATTVEVQAGLLRDALKKLSIEKPLLVGHSWGGSLALAAAVEYGDEFAGLVLLAPAAYPNFSIEWWSLLPHVPLLGNFFVNTLTPRIGRGIIKESLKEAYHPQAVQEDYAQLAAEMWTLPERVRACAYDERTLAASLKSLSPRYASLTIPVVIVTGDSDLLLKPKDHSHRLHREVPRSKLIVLNNTGHQIPQTRPESVIEAIEIAWREVEHAG